MKCPLCASYEVRKHQKPSPKNKFQSRYYCTSCSKYFGINADWSIAKKKVPHLQLNATKIWQQYVFEWLSFERIASLHNTSLSAAIKAFLMKNQDTDFTHTFYGNKIYKRVKADESPSPSPSLMRVDWPTKRAHELGTSLPCPVCKASSLEHHLWTYSDDINSVRLPYYKCKDPHCGHQAFEMPTQHPIPLTLEPHVIRLFNDEHMNVHHISHNLWLRISDIRQLLKTQNGKYPAGW